MENLEFIILCDGYRTCDRKGEKAGVCRLIGLYTYFGLLPYYIAWEFTILIRI